jgi:acyl-coenzyme A synthetase/AMP-(fatty) acid ligase
MTTIMSEVRTRPNAWNVASMGWPTGLWLLIGSAMAAAAAIPYRDVAFRPAK